ncbi:MAG: alpha/beta hydrolase [Pseudomonadota bacterium]
MLEFPLSNPCLRAKAESRGKGAAVILLHGFPDVRTSFAHQLTALSDAGYRAIAPSLRGYESTSLDPDADYAVSTLAQDLIALMDTQNLERVHLVGHDWGSTIAQACIATAPERFSTLTLISVPFTPRFAKAIPRSLAQLRKSWYMFLFQLPDVPERLIQRNNGSFLRWLWQSWSPHWDIPDEVIAPVKAAFTQEGVASGALSYYRQNFLKPSPATQALQDRLAAGIAAPTLAITGQDDGCIDARVFRDCMHDSDFNSSLSVKVLDGAGHFPHLELPEQFNQLLLNFISQSECS